MSPYLFLFAFGYFVSKGHGWKQKEPSRGDVCCLWHWVTNLLLGHSNMKVNGRSGAGGMKRRGEKSSEASTHFQEKWKGKKKEMHLRSLQNPCSCWGKMGRTGEKQGFQPASVLGLGKWWGITFFCVQEGKVPWYLSDAILI